MVQSINATTPLEEARAILATNYDLKYTKAVAAVTARVHDKLKDRIAEIEWPFFAPLIVQINRMKKEKSAIVLAHYFQSPQIYFGVADAVGDTVQLAQAAAASKARVIVQAGVSYMAETTKLLNPKKTVLIPDSRAASPLAASLTVEDVLAMKAQYPGVPVVAYINSSAAVKAVSDTCCTAANAVEVIAKLPGDRVIMLPDQFVARNTAKRTTKKIITWAGSSEVHETFSASDIAELRESQPAAKIVAHLECPPEVVAAADFAGSTSQLIEWVKKEKPGRVAMLTETAVADNLAAEVKGVEFVRAGNICANNKRINLENILWSLHTMTEEVTVPAGVAEPARVALERMIGASKKGD